MKLGWVSVESPLAVLGLAGADDLLPRRHLELVVIGELLELLDVLDGVDQDPRGTVPLVYHRGAVGLN